LPAYRLSHISRLAQLFCERNYYSVMKFVGYIVFIFLFLFVNSSFAQVRIGVFGGVNSTNFSGDNPPNSSFSSDYGYDFGGTTDFHLLDDVVINIQSVYSHKSTNLQYDVRYQYEPYDSISVNSTYFEIPVNVKVISNNEISYVTAGFSLGILVNTTARNNRTGNEENIEARFESYVWNASFGVGVQFFIGKPMLFVELRYSQSLTNLTSLKISEISINNKLKSNSIQLQTGLLFTL